MVYEYCIMRKGDDQDPHCGPWILSVCEEWIQGWIDNGRRGSTFYIARRPIIPWEVNPTTTTEDGRPIISHDHCSCGCGAHVGCFFDSDPATVSLPPPVCKECSGTGYISIPLTHPSNPNLDGWSHELCDCLIKRIKNVPSS